MGKTTSKILSESDLLKIVQLRATENGGRLFRNNIGLSWIGGPVKKFTSHTNAQVGPGDVLIKNARPLHAGLFIGSGDLIGWTMRQITPEMVGKNFAIFTSIECKAAKGVARPEQITWNEMVLRSGGISGIVKTQEEFFEAIRG